MNFKEWVRLSENNDAEQAILSIVAGNDSDLGHQEKDHLLNRRTTEFGNDIIKRIKNLGIISAMATDDQQKYNDIINSITHGMTIKELIDKVSDKEPVDFTAPHPNAYNNDPKLQPQQFQSMY